MSLNKRLVETFEEQYRDEVGEDHYQAECENLRKFSEKIESGTWTSEEVEWIVYDWKLDGMPRSWNSFSDNKTEDVLSVIENAHEADKVREKIETFTEDDDISGIGVPIASALLLFMNPEKYTVIDKRAWNTLQEMGYLPEKPSEFDIDDYLLYLGTCRTLAAEHDVGLRELDRTLWCLGE